MLLNSQPPLTTMLTQFAVRADIAVQRCWSQLFEPSKQRLFSSIAHTNPDDRGSFGSQCTEHGEVFILADKNRTFAGRIIPDLWIIGRRQTEIDDVLPAAPDDPFDVP